MKDKLTFSSLLLLALFSALAPTALASTTLYVNGANGSDGNNCKSPTTACKTIGHAISLAASGDSIMVAAATYKENLTLGISLNIGGSGVSATIIDGGGAAAVVTIPNTGASVILSRVTIRNGAASTNGGGIHNNGTLTINNSTISGNLVTGSCFPRPFPSCSGGVGGGIYNNGTLTINNSTISGNLAERPPCRTHYFCGRAAGGGIKSNGTLTINNTTISENGANGPGGGIAAGGTVKIQNSIIANSFNGGNCSGTMPSNGYNMSSDGTCNFSNSGDRNSTNPMLGPLQNNGGPTQTMALMPGSPAIDAGNPSGCTDGSGHLLMTDQRGMQRPDKGDTGGCDMGAYETQN